MKRIIVVGGTWAARLANNERGLFLIPYNQLKTFNSINAYDLLIIESSFTDETGTRLGKEIIFHLRLQMDCIIPILLVEMSASLAAFSHLQSHFKEVLLDPYVRKISSQDLRTALKKTDGLLDFFGELQSTSDRRILYEDLKSSIYRERGYISELRHSRLHDINRIPTDQLAAMRAFVTACAKEIDQALQQWKEPIVKREAVQQKFEECMALSDRKAIEDNLLRIYRSIEPELPTIPHTNQLESATIKVLYISQRRENHDRLKEAFQQELTRNFNLYFATDKTTALKQLRQNIDITSILCDYRFKEGNFVSRENGYHILGALKQAFPQKHYAYLTRFNTMRLVTPRGFVKIEVFSKNAVFKQESEEFFRLVKRIIQFESQIIRQEDTWTTDPKNTYGEDKIWKKLYRLHFAGTENFNLLNDGLNAQATAIIHDYLLGNIQVYTELPKIGRRLSRVYKKNKQQAAQSLLDRLLLRRIILGLYNEPRIADQYSHFIGSRENKDQEQLFELIHRLLKGNNNQIDFEDNKVRSNYFTEGFRIKIKEDYSMKNPRLSQLITYTEHRWLRHLFTKSQ